MPTVNFRQMKYGTKADYDLLADLEDRYVAELPDRILAALVRLNDTLDGYQVNRLEHALQTATRAEADGADDEMVLGALLHDLGDDLAPRNHGEYAAAILRPYVRPEVAWVVEHHGVFQARYYAHLFGDDPRIEERYGGHRYYDSCAQFCERWDQAAFDPEHRTRPLSHFEPLVRRIFARPHFDPDIVGRTDAIGIAGKVA